MDGSEFLAEFGHIANAHGGVEELRNLVLQLAISGRLANRENPETPVPDLIEYAAEQSRHYAAELNLRAIRPHAAMTATPYTIPDHWKWVRLEDLSLYIQRGKGPKYADQGSVQVISQKCVQWSGFDHSLGRYVADDSVPEYGEERFLKVGDLLWNSTGTGTAGRVVIYSDIPGDKAVVDSHVTVIRLASIANPRYVWCVIASPWVQARIQPSHRNSLVSGTTQQVELNTSTVRALPIPYPPVEEQTRIVEKVDELMSICDQLEQQQKARHKLQTFLRSSTLQAVASAQSPMELRDGWERLEKHFGQHFSQSRDLDVLRKALMDLAVSGLLSEQNSEDESAQILKQKILIAKARGIKEGVFSRKKNVKIELLEETTIPKHWEVIALDDAISTIDAGWSPACLPSARGDDTKWGVLKTTAVQLLRFQPKEHKELPASLEPRPQYQIELGDILITRAGPKNRVGICCVVDSAPQRLMISDKLIRIHIADDLIDPNFVALCLSAGEPGRNIEKLKSGMADSQMNISQDKLRSIAIPLPPLAEQQRILGALEGFMKTLDEYAEGLEKVARLGQQFSKAAIASITGISTQQEEDFTVKAPQTELVSKLRLSTSPDVKVQAPLATILARHDGELSARDLWQRFGGEIDAFYAQLKTEVAHGWIAEPAVAEMLERTAEAAGA